ncbi:MAG: heptaprenyl diphosphate synthase component 1 [Paenibacillus macerans]|uniref:Heptaprenyl diphosphate synthase n=1 Tax=Paenibacillus macerans TaxID=44252 RepID=A0A090ZZW0_PAEMA|nr:heptaprenyl diphosphate synthase component 1 [Paenibacillus macerans]KFN09581.1 heptaprenyl diphosphate synthase (HEPPP synthase) subunit 1 family protein [Paenibacillus macerans]MBS5909448.1 heptaprenyl diphosphate synthase component 1 [Paenibacillus macerans]MCY7561668.1 heptaprenyl diphosphate synthase component 1 [Paenibacillus macerans]MDU7476341.1 heptaprenyl diphosphate synthase component 1 [Paenibacillus macerans]MEC0137746.1 heptaprenyl diphosphate synthase component 1 [Paenibacill
MKPYRITELAKKYVSYDMISAHTALPDFPVPRVRLLYAFLNDRQSRAADAAETCALAAFLVQLGMDTHDLIDVEERSGRETTAMRSRQLKVLAGDYFSGVFYDLLAQAGEIGMVSSMSAAICEVNRLKVELYSKLKRRLLSAEEYLKECVHVKMGLFLSFSHLLDKPAQNLWRLLLAELSRCEVMLDEMKSSGELPQNRQGYAFLRILETGTAEDLESIAERKVGERDWSLLLVKYNVKEQLMSMLRQSVDRVQALLHECKMETAQSELKAILEPFIAALSPARRSAQEG